GLSFDADALEYVGVERGGLPNFSAESVGEKYRESGVLTFVWINPRSEKVEYEAPLFHLLFEVKKSFREGRLRLADGYTPSLAFDPSGVGLPIQLKTTSSAANAEFVLSPNPTSGMATIFLSDGVGEQVELAVYDLKGRLLRQQQMAVVGRKVLSLDLSDLPNGTYLVQVRTNEQLQAQKISLFR
ncbi:MAG: T9SS type A sorting domain-containing protein, partial [Bacteroidota bacterium]